MEAWIKQRLTEPSTWYGLGVLLAGVFSHFAPTEWSSMLAGIQWVLGGAAVVTPERK
jgi:hypothetical protein